MDTNRRFPRSLYSQGSEPDPRFTLANERTFLAWIRTSLALMAAGVALEVLGVDLQPDLRLAASLVLVLAGLATAVLAWPNWLRTEKSMRSGAALPGGLLALLLVAAVGVAGILVALGIVLR